jgi:predicted porin
MKKSLLALAALSAFATAAQAQSSVSVYGIVDAGWVNVKDDATVNKTGGGLKTDNLVSSRLGFKGTEDLGGGLAANFMLEGTLDVVNGRMGKSDGASYVDASATVFNRAAWVGLSSKTLGEIRLGRQDLTNMSNFFAAVATTAGNLQQSPVTFATADLAQAVNYISPTYAGFQLQAGHASVNTVTTTTLTEATTSAVDAYAIQYSAGKLTAVVGMSEKKVAAANDNVEELAYGVKYDFGFAEVAGGIHTSEETDGGSKKKGTMFSVAVPVAALGSNVKAHAVYVDLNDVGTPTNDTTAYRFALTKGFSKRTTGYVGYTSTKLKTATPTTPTSFLAGMVHSF